MSDIADKQEAFFQHLKYIQELSVNMAMTESKKNLVLEELLYSASYDTLYGFLELIDGYAATKLKLDLIDKETGISLRENIELHDKCADYLRSK